MKNGMVLPERDEIVSGGGIYALIQVTGIMTFDIEMVYWCLACGVG